MTRCRDSLLYFSKSLVCRDLDMEHIKGRERTPLSAVQTFVASPRTCEADDSFGGDCAHRCIIGTVLCVDRDIRLSCTELR